MKKLILPLALFGAISLSGCSSTTANPEEAAKKVVETFMEAAETEDLELLLSTIAEDNEYELVAETYDNLFDLYDLDYEIEDVTVKESTDEKVVLEVTQTVRKISGAKFPNSRVTAIHTLIKEDGKFKLQKTKYENPVKID